MVMKSMWSILGIESTKDKAKIQAAYREHLRSVNPEDDANGFMELRTAYDEAIAYANEAIEKEDTKEETDDDEFDIWMDKIEDLYFDIKKRNNQSLWKEVFEDDICIGLDTTDQARDRLLEFLMPHYYLPHAIWKLIDKSFQIVKDKEALCELYPRDFVEYVIRQIQNESFIDYTLFQCADDTADFDEYIEKYFEIKRSVDDNEIDTALQKITELEKHTVKHPFLNVEKIRCYLQQKEIEKADFIATAISEYEDNVYVALAIATVKQKQNDYPKAIQLWDKVCTQYPNNYTARVGYIEYDIETGAYKKANEACVELARLYPRDNYIVELLQKTNEHLIVEYEAACQKGEDDKKTRIELGWCYYQNSYHEKCLQYLETFSEEEKNEYSYAKLKGYVYLKQEELVTARHFLQLSLVRLASQDEDRKKKDENLLKYLIAVTYIGEKNYDSSISILKEIIEKETEPDNKLEYQERLAFTYYKKQQYEECIKVCDMILEQDEEYYPAYLYRQEANYNLENYDDVIDDYISAIRIFAEYVKPYVMAIKALFFMEDYENMKKLIDITRKRELKSFEMDLYEIKYYRMNPEHQTEKKPLIVLLQELEAKVLEAKRKRQNKIDTDEKETKGIEDEYDDMSEIYYEYVLLSRLENMPEKELVYIKQAITYKPDEEKYHLEEAMIYMEMGDYSLAINHLQNMIRQGKDHIEVLLQLAKCYEKVNKRENAWNLYQSIAAKYPDNVRALCHLINVYLDLYREKEDSRYYNEAKPFVEHLLDIERNFVVYYNVAMYYYNGNNAQQSIYYFHLAQQQRPDYMWVYYYLGVSYMKVREIDKAIEVLQTALEKSTIETEKAPYLKLANCYEILENYQEAEKCYLAVLEHNREDCQALDELADLFIRKKQYEKAIEIYQRLWKTESNRNAVSVRFMRLYLLLNDNLSEEKYARLACEGKERRIFKRLTADKRAQIYVERYDLQQAERYQKIAAIQLFSKDKLYIMYNIHMAHIYFELGKRRKSVYYANQALCELTEQYGTEEVYLNYPEKQTLHSYYLGMVYLILERYEQSEQCLQTAIKGVPCENCKYKGCFDALYGMALLYEARNEREKARQYFLSAFSCNPNLNGCTSHLYKLQTNNM